MDHLPEFFRNILANLVSNAILWMGGIIGGFMLALVVLLTRGLTWIQESTLALLFGFMLVMLGAAIYSANRYRKMADSIGGVEQSTNSELGDNENISPAIRGTRLAEVTMARHWKGQAEGAGDELMVAHAENLQLMEEITTLRSKLSDAESKAGRREQLTKELLKNAPRLFVEYEYVESPVRADVFRIRNDKDDDARSVTFSEIQALVKHRIVPLAAIPPITGGGPQVECIVACYSGIFGDDRPLHQILSEDSRNAVETVSIYYDDGTGNQFCREFLLKQQMRKVIWEPGALSLVRSSALEAL